VSSLFDFRVPGRLERGGPVFLLSVKAHSLPAVKRTGLMLMLFCGAAAGFLLPVFPAQSPASSSSSQPVAKKKKAAAPRSRRQLAPEPARIKEIQQALAREGFYRGEPTGKWDDATVDAMKNFQQARGLLPTGKIEALSLQKLGLGSSIAGLAPPAAQSPAAVAPASPPGAPQKP